MTYQSFEKQPARTAARRKPEVLRQAFTMARDAAPLKHACQLRCGAVYARRRP